MKKKNRENHPALNIDFKRIMIKATIFAFFVVISVVLIAVLLVKFVF